MTDIALYVGPTIKEYLVFRGSLLSLAFLLIFLLLPLGSQNRVHKLVHRRYDIMAVVLLAMFALASITYIAYPNYFDHAEPSITGLGNVLARGDALYPTTSMFPYHSSVYGPVLAEIQIAIKTLGLPIIPASKLPGVVMFVAASALLLAINKSALSRGYLLYLLPFAGILFWNRAEPFLLFLVCLPLFIGVRIPANKSLPILFGIIAGVASALKIHGAVYVFAAYLAVFLTTGVSVVSIGCFALAAMATFFVFFLPQQVSLSGLLFLLKSASSQGLSWSTGLQSFAYLIFLNAPIVILWRGNRPDRRTTLALIYILTLETLVTILAAKPGAGPHHLLPFIPVNAFLVQHLYATCPAKGCDIGLGLIRVLYASLVLHSLFIFTAVLVKPMIMGWHPLGEAKNEIPQFEKRYPGILMGATDDGGSAYTFYRAMLADRQIDYAFFMDLQYAGHGDEEFSRQMKTCSIRNIMLPNTGSPFTLTNAYTNRPLFSDDVRKTFEKQYIRAESRKYFTAYKCVQVP